MNKFVTIIIVVGLWLGASGSVSGQTLISGVLTDEQGEPLVGANVFIQDSFDGTSTDGEGRFSFSSTDTGMRMLLASSLGYLTTEYPLELKGEPITLTLKLLSAASELTTVTITAGAFEAGDEKKTTVLNSLDIVTTAGALADIASAMNTLPGAQRVGESGQLFVRGGSAQETRTFIDGMYVQNPFSSTTPNLPARGRFSPFLFKGTLFSTGGYSAEYGQALSSALLLNTQDLAPETLTSVSLMSVGGGASHTQRWKNTSLSASADYTNLGPYIRLVPQNIVWDKAPATLSGQVVARHKTSATGILKFQSQFSRSTFSLQSPSAEDVQVLQPLALRNDNYFASASYREVLGDSWSVFVGAAYNDNLDTLAGQFGLYTRKRSFQTRTTLQFVPVAAVSIKAGAEYLNQSYRERYTDAGNNPYQTELPEQYTAVFTETEWTISQQWAARGGIRLEHSALLDDIRLSPRLSMARKTGEHSQMSVAYGQFYQSPEAEQLRYNRQLDFEQANHYILNYQYDYNKRIFRLEGYYKQYQNLVKYPRDTPWYSDNSGDGYARGVDVFFRDSKSIKYTDYWVSYSFLDTRRLYRDFPEQSTPRFASAHNLSVVAKRWFPDITSSVGVTYAYGSPRPYDDPNTPLFNDARTHPYHDLSLSASYLTHIGRNFTIVHLSVNNLLGFKQEFGYQYSSTPNATGEYQGVAIRPPARQFFFIGLFVSIGKRVKINAEEALDQ